MLDNTCLVTIVGSGKLAKLSMLAECIGLLADEQKAIAAGKSELAGEERGMGSLRARQLNTSTVPVTVTCSLLLLAETEARLATCL